MPVRSSRWCCPGLSSLYEASICSTEYGGEGVEISSDGHAFVSLPAVLSGFAPRILKLYN